MEPDDQIPDEQIRARAHDIWDRHHRLLGYELEFWLIAERELKAERRTAQERPTDGPPATSRTNEVSAVAANSSV